MRTTRDDPHRHARGLLLGLASALLGLFLAACSDSPIVVGFSAQLTGPRSDLGVQGRNGALLAVERINADGGVRGRPLLLVAVDDGDEPDAAVRADIGLLERGAVAIIGHMTTSQTLAALPAVRARGGILISPTTSTPELDGLDDAFFRVMPSNAVWARALAAHARHSGLETVAVLGDSDNAGYTDTFDNVFMETFQALGGRVVLQQTFSSKAGPPWERILDDLARTRPEGLLISASARDVASLAQRLRRALPGMRILCSPWAATRALIQTGGRAVEGVETSFAFSEDNDAPSFQRFQTEYAARFGFKPNFAAAFAYEAVSVLASALERTGGRAEGLRAALTADVEHTGVIGPFRMDPDGDVRRPAFIIAVQNGRIVTLGKEAAP